MPRVFDAMARGYARHNACEFRVETLSSDPCAKGPYCETALCPRTPKAYEAVARMGPSHWLCCFECFGHAMRRARACGECGVPRAQDELTTIVRGMAVARVCESCKRLFDMDPNRSFSLAARPPVPLMSTEPALEDMVSKAFAVFLLETFACGIYLTQGRVGGSQPATLRGAGGSIAGIGKQSGTDFNAPFNTILIGSWTVLDSIDESPARLDDGAIAAADDQLLPPPMSPVLPVMPPPPPGGSRHVPMRPLSRSSRQLMSPVPPLPSALSSPQLNANNRHCRRWLETRPIFQ
jgi:hypothetical protein